MDYYKIMKKINRIIFPKHVEEYSAFYYHFTKPISEIKIRKVMALLEKNGMKILDATSKSVVFSEKDPQPN